MEQARVTDYFRACKRQPTKQRDEKLQFSYTSSFHDIKQEYESKNHLKLESTPRTKDLEALPKLRSAPLVTNGSQKAYKLRKRKADKGLLKTPTSHSSDGNSNTKLVSQSVRKRLLCDDSLQSTKPCKTLKFGNAEEFQGEKKYNTYTVLKEQNKSDGDGRGDDKLVSPAAFGADICQKSVSDNDEVKGIITENADLPKETISNENSFNIKEANGTETEMKVQLTNCKNTLKTSDTSKISPVQTLATTISEEQRKESNKGSTKEERMKAIQEKLSKLSNLKAELKATQEKRAELKEKHNRGTPAYQKYHYLASLPSKSLTLPYKYKSLEETFQSADRTVSILHNRHEVCTFSKLKRAVQQMTRRTFSKTHLGQIKTVFPQAYEFSIEKHLNTLSTDSSSGNNQLTVIPNFDYGNNENFGGVGHLCDQLQKTDIQLKKTEKSFVTMNSTCLSERQSIFSHNLLEMTKKHHEKFLTNLNPPVQVSSDKILRWHPRFPLDSVPDIPPAPLPELLDNKHYPTAKDVLNLINNKVEDKVENALQSIAEKHKEVQVSHQKPKTHELVKQGALKGISQALVEKIRAREALRMQKVMTRQPDVDKRLEMISRFPELVNIIRNYFITLQKAAIAIDDVSKKVSDSYRSHITSENAEQHLYLMADLLPGWISIITISKGPFVKIDKNKDVKIVIEKINQLIKQES